MFSKIESPLFQYYTIKYKTVTPTGNQRTGVLVLKCKDLSEARQTADQKLKEKHDWYRIGSIEPTANDNPQKSI